MELARQLKAKREERGLSQDEVSKAIFVSRQTISNWENDKTYPDVQSSCFSASCSRSPSTSS